MQPFALAHVPVAAVRPCPLEHCEVPALRRHHARIRVPVAAVRPCPLEHCDMPAPRRHHARVRVPVAAGDWAAQPLQHFKVPALRRRTACGLVPVAAVRARPLQRGQRAIPRGPRADLPRGVRLPAWTRPRPRPVQAPPHPRQPPHRPHHRRVPCAHPRARVRVAGRPHWEARPERVTQRAAGEREAERVVLVHRVGDEAEAAPRVEQAEGWRARAAHETDECLLEAAALAHLSL